jgi:hypothetical protein
MKKILLVAVFLWAEALNAQTPAWRVREVQNISVLIAPDSTYRVWYDELVEACHCKPAVAFDDILWYRAVTPTFPCLTGNTKCYGMFLPELNALFLGSERLGDEITVKHELLHAILGRADHPKLFKLLGIDTNDL